MRERRILEMKAVMYGGGNIGRGFIGAALSQSGYEVTFIDVAEPVVKALQEKHEYPVRYVSNAGYEDVRIQNVTAVNGNDLEAASEAIASCDLMATAVGARILKFIVPNIVAGLRKRWQRGGEPLNIIICENLMDANKVLEGMLKAQLTEEEKAVFDERVGLVEASIGRMVPVQTEAMKDGDPMRVCVERYGYLPVDRDAIKGEVPKINGLVPFSPFDFYIKRKLYVHNMGHAVCAYLGGFNGRKYIWQAINDAEILNIVQNAMLESAMALSRKYSVPLEQVVLHMTDLLERFRNRALMDTCQRVGGDPARKLGKDDRLIGSSLLALEQGITPAYIAVGAAGAVYRYLDEAGTEQTRESARKVLEEVSGLSPEQTLTGMILDMYGLYLEGATPAEMDAAAQTVKSASLRDII
jgi:mannitol-1-phosphate 5-dehydrogenase